MPFQNHLELIIKTLPGMMLRLIADITNCDLFLCSPERLTRTFNYTLSEPYCPWPTSYERLVADWHL